MKARIACLTGLLSCACLGDFVDCTFTADLDGTEQRYLLDAPGGANDVIVWLHGHGSDRTQVTQERGEAKSARDLAAERGMAICSPDYRASTSWMGPAAEADMLQLVGILTNRFAGRIFLVGGSMGGTSALTFAARHSELVAGVTAFNPLADHVSYTNFQDAIAASFGGTKSEKPDEYHDRSALNFPESFTMPLAVTLGGADTTVPPDSARALVKAVGRLHPGYVYLDDLAERGHETDYTASIKALREMFRMADRTHPIFAGGGTRTIAHWNFDDDPLGVTDASGHCNTLTNNGVRIVDGAAVFDGSPHVFSTVRPFRFVSRTTYTIECFVRSETAASATCLFVEVSSNAGNNDGGAFLCYPDGAMVHRVANDNWTGRKCGINILDCEWHHLAAVYMPPANTTTPAADANAQVMFYVDGVLQPTYDKWQGGDVAIGSYNVFIGSRNNQSYSFKGSIDDVRITQGALAPEQFLKERSQPKTVIAYWPFDARAPLVDASGNGNDLQNDGVTFSKEGAAVFSGEQRKFSTAGTFSFATVSSLTVEFFMRTSSLDCSMVLESSDNFFTDSISGGFCACLNEHWRTSGNDPYQDANVVGGSLEAGFQTSFPNSAACLDWTTGVSDGKWHHYAIIYDHEAVPSERVVRFFKDGVLQTGKRAGPGTQNFMYKTLLRSARLFIGSRNDSSLWFQGELDDVRLTARALDPNEFIQKRSRPSGIVVVLR